jgi:galactose mutarotase-like enzyme
VRRADAGDDGAALEAELDFGAHDELLDAFPFPHSIVMAARLRGNALSIRTTVTPTADLAVPVSFGFHPYLTLPGVERADWHVALPVRRRVILDDRGIPSGETEDVEYEPGPLGDRVFDDAFDHLADPADFVLAGGGRTITLSFGAGYPVAQVFAPQGSDFICFEPMTAPVNALVRGGRELPRVHPGESFAAEFTIAVEG